MSEALTRRIAQLGSLRVALVLALIWIIFQSQDDAFLSSFNLTNLVLAGQLLSHDGPLSWDRELAETGQPLP